MNSKELSSEFGTNVRFNYDLKKMNWFNIGGKSKIFYKADNLIYLLPKTKNKYPESWDSPYSSLIKMIPTKTKFFSDDWNNSNITLKKNYKVAGLIIMADGDNTNSKFETQIKSIILALKN